MSVDDYSSFKGLVEYMVRGYYVGTYKSAVEMRVGKVDNWFSGAGLLSPLDAQHIWKTHVTHLKISNWLNLWKETQIQQKTSRLIYSFLNEGQDPCPSHGFLEPWIALSISEQESPLLTLKRLMAHSEAMIRLILPSVTKSPMSVAISRDAYRAFISTLLDEKWTTPPPVDKAALVHPASAIEETFCRKQWKGKVTFPLGCWIGNDEIAYICNQICPDYSDSSSS